MMKTILKQATGGATAGIVAAFAMQQFVSLWHSTKGRKLQDGAFGLDREADINAAQGLWQFFFRKNLTEREAIMVARVMHYGYSAAASAGYAVSVGKNPGFRAGFGTVYGAVLWLVGDEIAITLMRLSDPRSKTKASHAVAFTAHLIFGSVAELSRRMFLDQGNPKEKSGLRTTD
ncbi:MAG: hypothetical protein JO150_11525 [Acidobacteriaceae bacterium]|nr:hypothetical protein [Acidobacteriaceae bacterium]